MIPQSIGDSKYFSITDVKTGDLLTFIDEGVEAPSKKYKNKDGSPKMQLQMTVKLPDGEEKTLTVNPSSYRNVANVYGPDTSAWVGKQARVNIVEREIQGEFVDTLLLTEPGKDHKGKAVA